MELKNVNDYIDKVHEKFDQLDKEEIKAILNYGFKNYFYINYHGGDVFLKELKNLKLWFYTGSLFKKFELYYSYSIKKMSTKLRILDARKKKEWDGYYYFGLTDKMHEDYEPQKDDEIIFFENIRLYRLFEELETHNQYKHYFKVKYPEYKGYSTFMSHCELEKDKFIKIK